MGVHFAFSIMPAAIVALTIPIMLRYPLRNARFR
jgi:Na+/melibiose symporter-like transporter